MSHNVPNRNWSYPTAIKFGVGRISELAGHCMASGITNPLLVTDRALASLPITAEAVAVLKAAGLGEAVFSDVDPNPNEINMAEGIKAWNPVFDVTPVELIDAIVTEKGVIERPTAEKMRAAFGG